MIIKRLTFYAQAVTSMQLKSGVLSPSSPVFFSPPPHSVLPFTLMECFIKARWGLNVGLIRIPWETYSCPAPQGLRTCSGLWTACISDLLSRQFWCERGSCRCGLRTCSLAPIPFVGIQEHCPCRGQPCLLGPSADARPRSGILWASPNCVLKSLFYTNSCQRWTIGTGIHR